MTPEEFHEGLAIAEAMLQGSFTEKFTDETLWPYFRDESAELWMQTCTLIGRGEKGCPILKYADFLDAIVKARREQENTVDAARARAEERRRRELEERRKIDATWTRSTEDILREQAENGNPFARRLLGADPAQEEPTEDE